VGHRFGVSVARFRSGEPVAGADLDGMRFREGIGTVAAPWIVFRFLHKAGLDRVAMHVAQLFDLLVVGEDVEVVVAGLPHELLRAGSGEALFEDLDWGGEGGLLGFGQEKVDVVGHEDVADEMKAVPLAGLFEDLLDGVACVGGLEDMGVAMAGDGDEVKMAGLVAAD